MNSTMLSFSVMCLVALFYHANCEASLPSFIKPCDFKDPKLTECITVQIQESLEPFAKGIPELDVASLDPVDLNDIIIDGNGLKLQFIKAAMHGLSKAKLTNLKINIGKSGEAFTLAFKSDLSLTAKYEVDGRILILPIQGKGDAVVQAKNVEVTIDGILNHVKGSKGEEHFKLATPTYKYTIEKTTFDLKNLFNGNKQLADTTLQFANENWQQLMDELAPPAIKQIVKTVLGNLNRYFSKISIKKMVKSYDS